ncbi:MAG: hypothetical protein F6K55_03255 [Moorea sp. SIO4A3]|nr:hypothetical protein [Moorena sp. SIO4A3]
MNTVVTYSELRSNFKSQADFDKALQIAKVNPNQSNFNKEEVTSILEAKNIRDNKVALIQTRKESNDNVKNSKASPQDGRNQQNQPGTMTLKGAGDQLAESRSGLRTQAAASGMKEGAMDAQTRAKNYTAGFAKATLHYNDKISQVLGFASDLGVEEADGEFNPDTYLDDLLNSEDFGV